MQIKHILFPVDFSDYSRALVPEVEWLADQFGANVTLLHVFEIPIAWYGTGEAPLVSSDCLRQIRETAEEKLFSFPLALPADRVNRVITEGDAAWHIRHWVENHAVDLVVIGTHGYGTMRRLLLGSVAMKVLHDVSCPVWTRASAGAVQHTTPVGISHIVCAIELTDETVPLLRFLKDVAMDFDASVYLVHSVPDIQPRSYQYFNTDLHRFLKECATEDLAKRQREAGTNFPVSVTDGVIAQDVAFIAERQQASLIVIGRGKAQATLGSLRTHAYDIIREARCPVLSYSPQLRGMTQSESEDAQVRAAV